MSIQYCYEKIAAIGSPVYYSLKKVNPDKRDALVVVAAFYQALQDVLLDSSDPNIAYQQLNWWRGEVIKIPQSLAHHPVCLAMQKMDTIAPQVLFDMIDGVEQTLAFQSFDNFEDVVVHIMRTGGAREVLMMDLLEYPEKIPEEIIYQFSIVLELVKYIQCLRHYVRRRLIMFPSDELQKFKVSPDSFYEFKTTPEIKNLLHFQVEKIERAYQKAMESLTPLMREQTKHLRARCEIALATLREIQHSGFTVLEHFIQLTPLKMWWLAYRVCQD